METGPKNGQYFHIFGKTIYRNAESSLSTHPAALGPCLRKRGIDPSPSIVMLMLQYFTSLMTLCH